MHNNIKKTLLFIFALLVLVSAFFALNNRIYKEKQGEPENTAKGDYKDTTFTIEGEKKVPQYFGNEAYGDLNGDEMEDIAFIVTDSGGGSGTFFYIVVALKTQTGYEGTNGVFLGDRIAPQSTEVRGSEIVVNYADRKDDEPMVATPTVGISKYFVVENNELVPLVILQ